MCDWKKPAQCQKAGRQARCVRTDSVLWREEDSASFSFHFSSWAQGTAPKEGTASQTAGLEQQRIGCYAILSIPFLTISWETFRGSFWVVFVESLLMVVLKTWFGSSLGIPLEIALETLPKT